MTKTLQLMFSDFSGKGFVVTFYAFTPAQEQIVKKRLSLIKQAFRGTGCEIVGQGKGGTIMSLRVEKVRKPPGLGQTLRTGLLREKYVGKVRVRKALRHVGA